MTRQIKTAVAEHSPSRWQKLQAWLTAFDKAMNYDPQENTDATIRHFREEVAQLATRVIELEERNQRILASLVADVVDGR